MPSQSRKHRGYASQKIVAEWFSGNGWPYAESTGAGRQGKDCTGMPGLAPEVKARRELNMTGSLKQATDNAGGELGFVVVRPDGYGPARIAEWPVIFTLEDATRLLRAAGYGDPE